MLRKTRRFLLIYNKSKLNEKRLVDRGYNIAFIANEFSVIAKIQRKTALTRKQKTIRS